jgi:predicted nucleotidyltransferase
MSKKTLTITELKALSPQISEKIPYLKMLVLFGSRATGRVHAESDWDFAALYDEEIRRAYMKDAWSWFEVDLILSKVFDILDTKVDVVELNHCSPLIGYIVARDGKLLYEKQPGEFTKFKCKAWKIYADTEKFRNAQRKSIELWLQKWGV